MGAFISCLKYGYRNAESRLIDTKHRYRNYCLIYTVAFILVFLLVFCWYLFFGKTFIWKTDGWEQHYNAYVYFAKYLRSIAKALFLEHRISFPEWDFALGEGNGILQTLQFYVIGDPFVLPSVFVPSEYMWVYYDFSMMLRLYCAGLTFSWLCFYLNKNAGRTAVLAGTVSYLFCFWGIYNTGRHPFFLNPMVFFPLIILGIEKIIKKEKPYVFIIAVFFSAINNFYFFYMIVLLTVVYIFVRLAVVFGKDIKKALGILLKISAFAILGALMASAILIPICYVFLNDARASIGTDFYFTYPMYYYASLPGILFSNMTNDEWLCLGFSSSAILGTVFLFKRKSKGNKSYLTLKILLAVCIIFTLVPACGQILNGISYVCNRWCWAFALLCSYISVVMWPELMNLSKKEAKTLFAFLAVCTVLCVILEKSRNSAAFAGIITGFLFVLVLLRKNNQNERRKNHSKQIVAFAIVVVSVANIGFFKNANSTGDYTNESVSMNDLYETFIGNEAQTIKKIAKKQTKDFYRYSGTGLTMNAGAVAGVSGTAYYCLAGLKQ